MYMSLADYRQSKGKHYEMPLWAPIVITIIATAVIFGAAFAVVRCYRRQALCRCEPVPSPTQVVEDDPLNPEEIEAEQETGDVGQNEAVLPV
jgi:hypothetical protein